MKRFLFSVSFVVVTFVASAQGKNSHFILTLNGGITAPSGNFAKSDYADQKSGFAGAGGHFNLTGTYFICPHFGITGLVGYSAFSAKGSQSLADGYKEDSGTDSTTLYAKGKNYSVSFLAGPVYRLDVTKKLSVDLRVLAGYVNTHLAGFQIFYEDYTTNAMSQEKSSGGGFGLQGGVAVGYRLGKRLGAQVNADYFTSKPEIGIHYNNFVVNSGRRLKTYKEAISGINATAGLTYTF